jgi:hypothetical protein
MSKGKLGVRCMDGSRMNTGESRNPCSSLLHPEMIGEEPFKAWVDGSSPSALTMKFNDLQDARCGRFLFPHEFPHKAGTFTVIDLPCVLRASASLQVSAAHSAAPQPCVLRR